MRLEKTGVAAAIAAVLAAPAATAQTSDEAVLEEIVVQGIRGSLTRASDIKRQDDAFVDALSAEGIGDFPDTNLAEALQRIAGVSIDRSNGEGEFVSVRGFGPEFNTVLFNGRQMPTTNGGRDFSFDVIASEMVSTMKVYKTSPVSLQAGGIGSTIDIQTTKPLDNPGFKVGYSLDALSDDASGETTPRVFASLSNTFADDTVGVYLAGAYQEREARIEEARTAGWRLLTVGTNLADTQFAGTAPADGTRVFSPFNYDHWVNNEERERTSFNGVVQWQASEDLMFTVDGLHSELQVTSHADALGQWFGAAGLHDAIQVDGNNTVTSFNRVGGNNDFIQRSFNRPDETTSFGFNADWHATDTINVQFDFSSASAESDNGGKDVFVVIGRPAPSLTYNGSTGAGSIATVSGYPGDLGTNFGENLLHAAFRHLNDPNGGSYKDDVDEARFDVTWSPDSGGVLAEVSAGLMYSDREKDNRRFQTPAAIRTFYAGYFQDAPSNLFSTLNVGGFLSDNGGGALPGSFVDFDPNELLAYLESPAALAIWDTNPRPSVSPVPLPAGSGQARLDSLGGSYAAQETGASFNVQEEIFDVYLDFKFEGELAGKPWTLTAGGRYTSTDVVAVGLEQELLDLQFTTVGSTLDATFGPDLVLARNTNDYSEFLPNLTFRYEPADNWVARLAYSETLTRPSPLNLAPRTTLGTIRDDSRTASSGNTALEPFVSKNIDLSVEWYPSDASSFALAYFRKDTNGLIVNGVSQVDLLPGNPFGVFDVSLPVNGEEAVIDGFEVVANYAFTSLPAPFDGLGVQFNATFVEADKEYSVTEFLNTGISFGVPGISDTTNFVAYYDSGPVEVRVAWNQRDSFLQQLANPTGGLPVFVDEYEQIDAQISYDFSDAVQVYFEAINIGNDVVESYQAQRNQFLGIVESGPRYSIGLRGTFQ